MKANNNEEKKSATILQDSQHRMDSASEFWQREKGNDLKFEKSLSHHFGARNWEEENFYAHGNKHVELYKQLLRFNNRTSSSEHLKILEWGPGGGANAVAFGHHFSCDYIGVDISQENLDESLRMTKQSGLENFIGFHIDIQQPEAIFEKVEKNSIDFYLCTAVFPHLPDKDYAIRLIDIAAQLLKPDGLCMLHILLSDTSKDEYGDYAKDVHKNTVFTYEEAIQDSRGKGLADLYAIRDDLVSYSYFFFQNT